MMEPSYQYEAVVVRWVDGDTVILDVDLGFKVRHEAAFRLTGVDTPERGRPGWAEASAYCRTWCPAGSRVLIDSAPPTDKYGRYLVTIQYQDHWGRHAVLNWQLIDQGLAVRYDGGKKP